ncbi:MAG: hypothetical protein IT236_05955 [Bacteroidia bacterium]|nr:hypothetical protein [Bacteroidia bacterium]
MIEMCVIPECYGDTLLVKTLGYSSPNHKHGIGEVNNTMKKYFNNRIAIGVIDNDKAAGPSDFNRFVLIESKGSLSLKKRPGTQHFLITLNPALERWIEEVGNSVNVTRPYSNYEDFKKALKDFNVEKDAKITTYFNTIKQKNPTAFRQIKNWIRQIENNEFNS